MVKKTFSLILAALLMAQVLVGCGSSTGDGGTTTPADTSVNTTEETIPDEPDKKNGLWYADYLPEMDYEGYTFRVLTMEQFPTDVAEEDGDRYLTTSDLSRLTILSGTVHGLMTRCLNTPKKP